MPLPCISSRRKLHWPEPVLNSRIQGCTGSGLFDCFAQLVFLCTLLVLASCASQTVRDGAPAPGSMIPQELPPDAVPQGLGDVWMGAFPNNTTRPRATVSSLSLKGVIFATDMPADHAAQFGRRLQHHSIQDRYRFGWNVR